MMCGYIASLFQSAPPVKGVTPGDVAYVWHAMFQSAPPVKGATSARGVEVTTVVFQSAPPVKGATRFASVGGRCLRVSIRAPREGGDQGCLFRRCPLAGFNPRPP